MPLLEKGDIVEVCAKARLETSIYWYQSNHPSDLLKDFSKVLIQNGKRILESPPSGSLLSSME